MLIRPVWAPGLLGYDIGYHAMRVQLRPVPNASKYRICLRDFGASNCYFNEERAASSGFLMNDGSIGFTVSIPPEKQTTISEWRASACYSNNQCGNFSQAERFVVVPHAPSLTEPADPTTITNSRTVVFRWVPNPLANAGYQLILFTRPPEEIGFNIFNPTAIPPPSQKSSPSRQEGTAIPFPCLRVRRWSAGPW